MLQDAFILIFLPGLNYRRQYLLASVRSNFSYMTGRACLYYTASVKPCLASILLLHVYMPPKNHLATVWTVWRMAKTESSAWMH